MSRDFIRADSHRPPTSKQRRVRLLKSLWKDYEGDDARKWLKKIGKKQKNSKKLRAILEK